MILQGMHTSSVTKSMAFAKSQMNHISKSVEFQPSLDSPKYSFFVATINCKHRLPTDFKNVYNLFKSNQVENDKPVDLICVNLQ